MRDSKEAATMSAIKFIFGLSTSILLAFGNAAFAQQFAGRNITMIVSTSAGGPNDIEARLVAHHIAKYLQGLSSIVVRNVGGAGGNIGVSQLGESPERERLNLGFFTWNPLGQLIKDPTLRVRYNDLKFIAGFRQVSLLYMRRDTPPGISRPADVAKAVFIKAGALSLTETTSVRQRLALDLLGVKYETIPGWKGLRDIELAMQRGDLHLTSTSLPSWFASVKPNLINTGIAIPLFQYDFPLADGKVGRNPDLPDVPTFTEVYKEIRGPTAAPSGQRWEIMKLLTRIMDSVYRTVFMPPNAPAAAVEEMRAAFETLARDPEYIADYERVVRIKPRFVIGTQGEEIVAELANVPQESIDFLKKYVANSQ